MKKKSYVKNNKLYLGGKKQKGSFLPLLGIGASLGIPIIKKLLFGKGKRRRRVRRRRW